MRPDEEQDVRDAPLDGNDNGSATKADDGQLVRVLSLRPTQLAVGYQAAQEKADRIADMSKKQQDTYLQNHPVPVVLGPDGNKYIIDHHHLCYAVQVLMGKDKGKDKDKDKKDKDKDKKEDKDKDKKHGKEKAITEVYFTVREDWSKDTPDMDAFWSRMQAKKYVWLNDPAGKQISFQEFLDQLPENITGLKDDPYRSLAASVRREGGYEKDWDTPYAEFYWANFFRTRVPLDDGEVNKQDVKTGVRLAQSSLATGLPGSGGRSTGAAPASDRGLPPAACSCAAVDAAA